MRISDWSSDVCSSDLAATLRLSASSLRKINNRSPARPSPDGYVDFVGTDIGGIEDAAIPFHRGRALGMARLGHGIEELRSEEHTSELQSLMRISYAVFCLTKTRTQQTRHNTT